MRCEPLIVRFWRQVQKSDGCWIWMGRRSPKGYGLIAPYRRDITASRVSWELHVGPIPDGMFVLHHCDNPPCVRPDHLFLGTLADNNADMKAKGRAKGPTWKGSEVPAAKLTEVQVTEIRHRYATGGISQHVLAAEYGLTQPTINALLRRRTWRHVA